MNTVTVTEEYANAKYEVVHMYARKKGDENFTEQIAAVYLQEDAKEIRREHGFPKKELLEINGQECFVLSEATPTRFNENRVPIYPYKMA